MSFIHYDIVAIIDPKQLYLNSQDENGMAKLNISRAISFIEFDSIFGKASDTIKEVTHLKANGSIWSYWSEVPKEAEEIHSLSKLLADRVNGVVITNPYRIIYPKWAETQFWKSVNTMAERKK